MQNYRITKAGIDMKNFDKNRLKGIELNMLIEADRICRKNKIKYYIACGTLLGAVRHKGFIPWDDDVDIFMPVRDYLKFCKIAPKQLDKKYFFQYFGTDNTSKLYGKIRCNGTTYIEKGMEGVNIHQGVWIDIFPVFGVSDKKKYTDKLQKKNDFARKILRKKIGSLSGGKQPLDKKILKLIPHKLIRKWARFYIKSNFRPHSKFEYFEAFSGEPCIIPRFHSAFLDKTVELDFENHRFYAPQRWDDLLSEHYGDYMTPPPPEKRVTGEHSVVIADLDHDYSEYIK